jgi:multicomponent Na+:H+ antiporter subunit F
MIANIVVYCLVGVGVLFAVIRLLLGPTAFDRVVGLDTLNIIITALIAFLAFVFKNALYLDIALAYGILSFVETVVFARFLEGRK